MAVKMSTKGCRRNNIRSRGNRNNQSFTRRHVGIGLAARTEDQNQSREETVDKIKYSRTVKQTTKETFYGATQIIIQLMQLINQPA